MRRIGAGGLTPILGVLVIIATCLVVLTVKAFT